VAVVIHGVGHDPVDKQAAARSGVVIANTPGANAQSVAELAVGLALAVCRRIPAADRAVRGGQKGFRETAHFTELSGKTALIVGWGSIGGCTGRMLAQAFGMQVLVYSPRSPLTGGFQRVQSLVEGLAQADSVSLHTPLRQETHNLMNTDAFLAMKRGAILINMARAGLVDESALHAALATGHLGGAGLDVYSDEAPEGPLPSFDNVVFTPHLGGSTEDALRRVALEAARHVVVALDGQLPETTLNSEVWRSRG
jgi:D-3-phosphoglycerate dehydrogenase